MKKTKFIRIRNVGDKQMLVPRIALEKLGLSTKRNDADTIGRFGSGIKFAPIAALRNGWDWWFVGHDSKGSYFMQYVVREEDGVDCIWYDYGDDVKPSSFTLGAGELSWNDPFQIIREPIANAMDGVKDFGGSWSIEIVDEILDPPDYGFDVYITAAPELIDIIDNIDLYFSHNRNELFRYGGRSAVNKIDSKFRAFSQNVLVYSNDEYPSMFDYEFDYIDLNEERTVKSEWDLCWGIANILRSVDDPVHISDIIGFAMRSTAYFEFEKISSSNYTGYDYSSAWIQTFKDIHGENAVIYPYNDSADAIKQHLRLRGSVGVCVLNDGAYNFLAATGIPNYMQSLGEEFEYEIDDDISKSPVLTKAMAIVRTAFPDMDSAILDTTGILRGEASLQCKGLTINKDDKTKLRVLISEDHLENSSLSDIVATIIHEYDHAETGIGDGYSTEGKQFRDLADKRLGRIVVKNTKVNPFFIHDGMVSFKVSDMALIGQSILCSTERVNIFDGVLMKVGDFILKLSGDDYMEVDCDGNAHEPRISSDGTVVSYPTIFNTKSIEVL